MCLVVSQDFINNWLVMTHWNGYQYAFSTLFTQLYGNLGDAVNFFGFYVQLIYVHLKKAKHLVKQWQPSSLYFYILLKNR